MAEETTHPRRSMERFHRSATERRGLSAITLICGICIFICMPSRNIAVQRAVYDALTSEKRGGESFTALLRRLLEQREGLSELVGEWGRSGERADRAALRALRAVGRRNR